MSGVDQTWQVYRQGQTWGPYSAADIQSFLDNGQMEWTAMVFGPGMTGWLPASQVFHPAVAVPIAEPVASHYTPSYATRRPPKNLLARWKFRCGGRSFLFQLVCIGWTALIGGLTLAQSFGIVGGDRRGSRYYHDPDDTTVKAVALTVSWACMGGAWLLIFLPCGIAAIATYEGNDPSKPKAYGN